MERFFVMSPAGAMVLLADTADKAIEQATAYAKDYPGEKIEVLRGVPHATVSIPPEPQPIITYAMPALVTPYDKLQAIAEAAEAGKWKHAPRELLESASEEAARGNLGLPEDIAALVAKEEAEEAKPRRGDLPPDLRRGEVRWQPA